MLRNFKNSLDTMMGSIEKIEKELERITVILKTYQFKEELMKKVWDPETKHGKDLIELEFENSEKE